MAELGYTIGFLMIFVPIGVTVLLLGWVVWHEELRFTSWKQRLVFIGILLYIVTAFELIDQGETARLAEGLR